MKGENVDFVILHYSRGLVLNSYVDYFDRTGVEKR